MQESPEITFKNLDVSEVLEARIRERLARLERFHHGIVGARVVVDRPHKAPGSGKNEIVVQVEVEIPGKLLISRSQEMPREAKDDQGAVVTHVFDAMERQLDGAAAREKRQVKAHSAEREIGRIARVFPEQGYGFVQVGEGDAAGELYFTANALDGLTLAQLQPGMMVKVVRAHDDGPMGPLARHIGRLGDENRMAF